MTTSSAIQAVAGAVAPPATCGLCKICGQEFIPLHARSKGMLCHKPACRSELGRRNGGPKKREARTGAPIKPIATQFRTILQPQIADYIASLAAANTSMVGVGA